MLRNGEKKPREGCDNTLLCLLPSGLDLLWNHYDINNNTRRAYKIVGLTLISMVRICSENGGCKSEIVCFIKEWLGYYYKTS